MTDFNFSDVTKGTVQEQEFSFNEMSYKEFLIPKKNKKFRKICSPNTELRNYQKSELPNLYKHFDKLVKGTPLENSIHGFLPGKNCVTAAVQHLNFKNTTMLDITNFFDSVFKESLPKKLRKKEFFHKDGYCAQGFCTSPILTCISTVPMYLEIHDMLSQKYDNFCMTVYADDIQISTNSENRNIGSSIEAIVKFYLNKYNFILNEKKTRTKYSKYGARRILGLNCTDKVQSTRKTNRKLRAATHQNNLKSKIGLANWAKCSLPLTEQEKIAAKEQKQKRAAIKAQQKKGK